MAPRKTHFNDNWLSDSNYSQWIARCHTSDTNAYCDWCKKKFSFSNMGNAALSSHIKSAKHQKFLTSKANNQSIENFINNNEAKEPDQAAENSASHPSTSKQSVEPSCTTIGN